MSGFFFIDFAKICITFVWGNILTQSDILKRFIDPVIMNSKQVFYTLKIIVNSTKN